MKTEIEKAAAYFKLRGIESYFVDEKLYIITPDSNAFEIMLDDSEIIYRAELYDECMKYED